MKTIQSYGQWILTETESPEAVLQLKILKNQPKDFTMKVSEAKQQYMNAMINELKELAATYGSMHVTHVSGAAFSELKWDYKKDEYWPYTLRYTAINELGQALIGGTKGWDHLSSLSFQDIQVFHHFITTMIIKESMVVFENRELIKKTLNISQSTDLTQEEYEWVRKRLQTTN